MSHVQTVSARSEGIVASFALDWETHTWSSHETFDEGDFPFITAISDVPYEIYSDHTFREVGHDDSHVLSRLKPRAREFHEPLR